MPHEDVWLYARVLPAAVDLWRTLRVNVKAAYRYHHLRFRQQYPQETFARAVLSTRPEPLILSSYDRLLRFLGRPRVRTRDYPEPSPLALFAVIARNDLRDRARQIGCEGIELTGCRDAH
jgi:hypothetical protein